MKKSPPKHLYILETGFNDCTGDMWELHGRFEAWGSEKAARQRANSLNIDWYRVYKYKLAKGQP